MVDFDIMLPTYMYVSTVCVRMWYIILLCYKLKVAKIYLRFPYSIASYTFNYIVHYVYVHTYIHDVFMHYIPIRSTRYSTYIHVYNLSDGFTKFPKPKPYSENLFQ